MARPVVYLGNLDQIERRLAREAWNAANSLHHESARGSSRVADASMAADLVWLRVSAPLFAEVLATPFGVGLGL